MDSGLVVMSRREMERAHVMCAIAELHGLRMSVETLRQGMLDDGAWKTRAPRLNRDDVFTQHSARGGTTRSHVVVGEGDALLR